MLNTAFQRMWKNFIKKLNTAALEKGRLGARQEI